MYQVFELTARFNTRPAFEGRKFVSISEVKNLLADIIVYFEPDPEFDAADFMTKGGGIYSVERIKETEQ